MTTFTHTANPALYREVGIEAQTRDQVLIHLDQEKIPAFPENITGTIQVGTTLSCAGKVYTIEYDETDLDGSGVEFIEEDDVDSVEVVSEARVYLENSCVRYDVAQTLTEDQQQRARENIGVVGSGSETFLLLESSPLNESIFAVGDVPSYVRISGEGLTDALGNPIQTPYLYVLEEMQGEYPRYSLGDAFYLEHDSLLEQWLLVVAAARWIGFSNDPDFTSITTWVPDGDNTGSPAVEAVDFTAGYLGQTAFVVQNDTIVEKWLCVSESPTTWRQQLLGLPEEV